MWKSLKGFWRSYGDLVATAVLLAVLVMAGVVIALTVLSPGAMLALTDRMLEVQ